MASGKDYLEFILDQLSGVDVAFRAMMGEYIIYCRGKTVGGIYDNRFLIKITDASEKLLPEAPRELPYEGAKPMLLVEDVDDAEFLCRLVAAVEKELPAKKQR